MSRGIIYVMSTVVSGLVKIGKSGIDQFETRMKHLESNGYANITGLKRAFAIEVDKYGEKERLIHDIFSKSRIAEKELFAVDIETVKSLLASFDGKTVYPKDKSKKEVFIEATKEIEIKQDNGFLPDGKYVLARNVRGFGRVDGKAIVKDGVFTLLKGSTCANAGKGYVPTARKNAKIVNNILQEDMVCDNPTSAGWVVIGKSNNGWVEWKDTAGNVIDVYRHKES